MGKDRGNGHKNGDDKKKDEFELEEKWDKNEIIPEVCRLPEPTEVKTSTTTSRDTEETSSSDSATSSSDSATSSSDSATSSSDSATSSSDSTTSSSDSATSSSTDSSSEWSSLATAPITAPTTAPTNIRMSPVVTEKYFTCDQLPNVTAAPKEIKPRSKRNRRNRFRKEKRQDQEEEEEEKGGAETRPLWDFDDITERPRQSSIRTWKPDYFEPMTPADSLSLSDSASMDVLPSGTYFTSRNIHAVSTLKGYGYPLGQRRNRSREESSSDSYDEHPANKGKNSDITKQNYKHGKKVSGKAKTKERDTRSNDQNEEQESEESEEDSDQNEEQDKEKKGNLSKLLSEVSEIESDPVNASPTNECQEEIDDEEENSRPKLVDYVSALSFKTMKEFEPSRMTLDPGIEILSFDFISFFRRRLPFCGLDEIRKEWTRKKYDDWRDFVKMMREIKVRQLLEYVKPFIPHAEEEKLKREMREILSSNASPEEVYIAIRKMLKDRNIPGFADVNPRMEAGSKHDSTEGNVKEKRKSRKNGNGEKKKRKYTKEQNSKH